MTTVWVLIFYMSASFKGGGPAIIDNLPSSAECERVASVIKGMMKPGDVRCIEVSKVK